MKKQKYSNRTKIVGTIAIVFTVLHLLVSFTDIIDLDVSIEGGFWLFWLVIMISIHFDRKHHEDSKSLYFYSF